MKNYTKDWNIHFTNNVTYVKDFNLCLEIGCFEGLTSNYIVENLMFDNGTLVCVDPLTDNYLNTDLTTNDIELNKTEYSFFEGQYDRFINNVQEHIDSGKIVLYRDLSFNVYDKLRNDFGKNFSFIYIDGDHRPESVYIDAINSFDLCKKDGYILFDDFLWKDTKLGINKFISEYLNELKIIQKGEQLLIKKL